MKKTLSVCLSVLLTLLLLSFPAGAGEGAALTAGISGPDEAGIYRLEVRLSDVPEGAVCGLMLSVSLPDGWRIAGAEQGRAYLTLTLRTTAGGARILLDGIPTETDGMAGGPLVRLLLAHPDGAAEGAVTLTAESLLYYMESPGCMNVCQVCGCRAELLCPGAGTAEETSARAPESPTETEQSGEPASEQSGEPASEQSGEPASEQSGEPASEPGREEAETPAGQGSEAEQASRWTLVGCREAVTADGLTVEMLFLPADGAGNGCPAAWLSVCPGGVCVTLKTAVEGAYTGVIFSGLPLRGRVVPAAADADGRVFRAVYTDGRFEGWYLQ